MALTTTMTAFGHPVHGHGHGSHSVFNTTLCSFSNDTHFYHQQAHTCMHITLCGDEIELSERLIDQNIEMNNIMQSL